MIRIEQASLNDIETIRSIAQRTWPSTFGAILSESQIAYMLKWMYSPESLKDQMENLGHQFFIAWEEDRALGFTGIETGFKGEEKTKIHKLYILPETQGKGIGRKLLETISKVAKSKGDRFLCLNVNKYNDAAIKFYEKVGFYEAYREVIDIGQGFVMDDVVMEKVLL